MTKKHSDKLPLYIGVGLPILLIVYIIATVYIPTFFIKPKFNFLYTKGCYDNYEIRVVSGKITWTSHPEEYDRQQTPITPPQCIYLYDVIKDSSTPITFDQAQLYTLDPSSKSPDGFTVSYDSGSNSDYFPFFWTSSSETAGTYINGNGLHKRIADNPDYNYDYDNLTFIGWIIQ